MSLRERVSSLLASPRIVLVSAIAALCLTATSLGTGLHTEDFLFRVAAQRELTLDDVNLYDAEEVDRGVAVARSIGTLPWITPDEFAVSFWRPLASLGYFVDFRLWPGAPWRLHLESLLIYALLAAAAALLYRRVLDAPAVAGFAALLYAIDDAHGPAAGWIANRHALLGAAFGTFAVWLHARARDTGSRWSAALSLLALGLGLASSELALSAALFVVAHALTLDRAAWSRRLLALAPALALSVAWAIGVRALGHGAVGSGTYVDALRHPGEYLAVLPERAGTLLLGQLGAPPSDRWHVVSPAVRALFAVAGFALALLFVLALGRRLRSSPALRFFALGGALSILPVASTFPSDRLLYFVGLGTMPLIASVIAAWLGKWPGSRLERLLVTALGPAALALHGIVAPLLLPLRTLRMADYHDELVLASDSAYDVVQAPDETLVVVNAPDFYWCKMLREVRWTRVDPHAVALHCLAGTLAPTRVTRLDPNAIEVEPAFGFLERPFNRTYRNRAFPMKVGDSVFVGAAQVMVTAVDERGAPMRATFRFIFPLESEKLRFVVWRDARYEPFSPPPIGQSVVLAPLERR